MKYQYRRDENCRHFQVLAPQSYALTPQAELNCQIQGEIPSGNSYHCSKYAKEMKGDRYACADRDAVGRVADRIVLRLTQRQEHRIGRLIEQGVPESECKNGDHPRSFAIAMIIEMHDQETALIDHNANQYRTREQGKKPVAQKCHLKLVDGLMDNLRDERISYPIAKCENDCSRDIGELVGESVNAKHRKANQPPQDQSVRLSCKEGEGGGDHKPLAKMHYAMHCFPVPAKGIANARGHRRNEADTKAIDSRNQLPSDDRPNGRPKVRPCEGNNHTHERRRPINRKQPPNPHMPR